MKAIRILMGLLLCANLYARPPFAPGAVPRLVADGFRFTEGPAVDRDGNVYFTDQPNDRILKWDAATDSVVTFMQPCGRSNGLYFDADGNLIACADEKSELWCINVRDKSRVVLAVGFGGKRLNGPNDVWVHPNGGLYFTDPFCKRSYWEGREKPDQEAEAVYYLAKASGSPVRVDVDFVRPNGIIGTPDGKTLYVADIGAGRTYRYRIGADGMLRDRALFCSMGSDGMTLDAAGNLYLTGKEVTVVDPSGRQLGTLDVGKKWVANVCVAGRERNQLFITASDAVFVIRLEAAGTTP